jgi:uncharacterized membrane protein
MNKEAFLAELGGRLSGLPEEELAERLSFYREMIEDRVADGQSEEEAVAAIGTVEDIAQQITAEVPLGKIVGEKVRRNRPHKGWEIALLILGAPLWLPLLIAGLAIVLSVYVVLWALVISLWAVDLSLGAAAAGCVVSAVPYLRAGSLAGAGTAVGAGLICAGLAILLFHLCVWLTKAVIAAAGKTLLGIKASLMKKEA